MNQTLGKRIGALRREKGLKQDELAEKLGISPSELIKETLRTPADLKKTVPLEALKEICEEKSTGALIAR